PGGRGRRWTWAAAAGSADHCSTKKKSRAHPDPLPRPSDQSPKHRAKPEDLSEHWSYFAFCEGCEPTEAAFAAHSKLGETRVIQWFLPVSTSMVTLGSKSKSKRNSPNSFDIPKAIGPLCPCSTTERPSRLRLRFVVSTIWPTTAIRGESAFRLKETSAENGPD